MLVTHKVTHLLGVVLEGGGVGSLGFAGGPVLCIGYQGTPFTGVLGGTIH